jgi:hypothetical protein
LSGPRRFEAIDLTCRPIFLDTLAWAYFRNGDASRAIATEKKALALLPADQKSGIRAEIEKGLAEFEAAAKR